MANAWHEHAFRLNAAASKIRIRQEHSVASQLTRGLKRRLMYVENRDGTIEGAHARIGWITFSKSAKTVYYRGRELAKSGGQGIRGNFRDVTTGEEFWVSGVKRRGSNAHPAEHGTSIIIDDDAQAEYRAIRSPHP
jgi:hypothetical protein